MWKGLGYVMGMSVGRGGRFASGESCLWAAADFTDFFLDAWGEDVVVRRTDCSLEAVTILRMDDAAPFDIESSRNLTRAINVSHYP